MAVVVPGVESAVPLAESPVVVVPVGMPEVRQEEKLVVSPGEVVGPGAPDHSQKCHHGKASHWALDGPYDVNHRGQNGVCHRWTHGRPQ